ncbi:MAG: hypothetical protein GTN80_06665 [Nitrososphaeria archaeon]|nr:hypothetical protein [Nitrososphaeria archaeon]NIQ33308.1 hypothetical protein [Nitrososphaeria archaeon]
MLKLRELGIQQFKVVDVRKIRGLTKHLVRVSPNQIDAIRKGIPTKIKSSGKYEKKPAFWFDSDGCEVCNTMLSRGSFLISGRNIEDYTLVYSFIAPNFDAFTGIISTLEASDLKPKILKMIKYKAKGKVLTEKQERVLWFALKTGYYEYPRKINSAELSRRLGIGLSTLSEITRRGIRKLLEYHLEDEET